jgi:diacylglycerol kinase (ATP)
VSETVVIVNPGSGRGRGKGLALAEQLSHANGIDVTVLQNFENLWPALQRAASNNVKRLIISSGDGTIHAIQTWLAENIPPEKLPQICLLPHGTTNMTAADLGFRNRTVSQQAEFIRSGTPSKLEPRQTVRVANPKSGRPLHGMFFGTGAIPEATRYCQKAFNDRGVGGNWATFATLAKALGKTMFSKPDPRDVNRFDRPHAITLEIEGKMIADGQQLFLLVTTLNTLILHSRPFWGGADKPLRTTTIPYPVPNPVRWVLPTLFGSESRTPPPGSHSIACSACTVTSDTEFVMDGEFYDAPGHAPLQIEVGPQFQYIIT